MNILRFMTPKQDVAFIYEDFTLRQTLETWENHRYASIPVLRRTGEYVGTMTEGDILWGIKRIHGLDMEQAEETPISSFPRKRDYRAVPVFYRRRTASGLRPGSAPSGRTVVSYSWEFLLCLPFVSSL